MKTEIPPPSEADLSFSLVDAYARWTDGMDYPLAPGGVLTYIRRCHAAEAECERLRKELKDYVDAASVEAFEGDLARKDAASLAAELDEAVELLGPLAVANRFISEACDPYVTVRIAVQSSDHPDIKYRLITRDFRLAAAFVAKHKEAGK